MCCGCRWSFAIIFSARWRRSRPAACGLILSGAGLWLCWRREAWYLSRRLIARSEHRIVLAGAVVLASIVSGAVLAGVIVMQQHAEEIARADRLEILKGRVDLFRINIDLRSTRAALVASRPNLTEQLARLNADPGNGPALARLRNAAESFLPWGFSALAFRDANGRELVQHGRFAAAPEMAFELRSRNAATLLWDNGYVLRSRMPMLDDGKVVGYMSAEQRLPVLTASMQGVETGSQSAEVAMCGRIHDGFECFPQRFVKHAFFLPYSQTLPMAHALAGDLGVRIARDYRGENVLAAHGPIGDFGLGMVVKIDTAELFAPLRESLSLVFLLLLLMLVAGTWLIYRNIAPLARELALSEARLALALESSGIALFDWDMQTNLVYLGAQWEAMLGREPLETVVPAVQLQEITHPEDRAALAKHLHAVLKGGTPKYDLEHRVQAADGQWKWIRSRGRTVEHNHQGRATRLIGTNADITARKAAEFALSHRASHDVLTGLPNRSLFNDRLALAVARAKRNKTLMAVMYLDIDKFKSINDTLGHDAGDLLLKEFSGRLAGCVRNTDTAARLGGDEFVVILESLPAREDGHRIAEKIVAAMRAEFVLAGRALTVTTSAGMAFLEAGVEADPDALLKKADEALYKAKAAGRNNFQMAG